jgi:hypothetical protein
VTGIVLRQPQHTHRLAALTADPYGGFRAVCTCRESYSSGDRSQAVRSLRLHISGAERKFRKVQEELWQTYEGSTEVC